MFNFTPFSLFMPYAASKMDSRGDENMTSHLNRKFSTRDNSNVQEQKPKRKLKFKLKKRWSNKSKKEVNVVNKSCGPSVRDENIEPVVEGSKPTNVGESISEPNQIIPGIKNISSPTDSNLLPRVAINSIQNGLGEIFTANFDLVSSKFHLPLGNSALSATEKVQMYLSSIEGGTFDPIYDPYCLVEDSRVNKTNRSRNLRRNSSSFFQDLFPHISQNDAPLGYQQTRRSSQLIGNHNYRQRRGLTRLLDYSLSGQYFPGFEETTRDESSENLTELAEYSLRPHCHSILIDHVSKQNSANTDYFSFNGRQPENYSMAQYKEDEGFNERLSQRQPLCSDSVYLAPERLFQVTVLRDDNGFGFSLEGDCPPRVASVDDNSPASEAGIMEGDKIIKVNSQEVYQSCSETVALFIRAISPMSLVLELHRDSLTPEARVSRQDLCDVVYDDNKDQSFLKTADCGNWDDKNAEIAAGRFKSPSEQNSMTTKDLTNDLKQFAIQRLMSLEEEYINSMHYGMETISRPLRDCILSNYQYGIIFQNIEKLVAISEYNVQEMKNKHFLNSVGLRDLKFNGDSHFTYLPALVYEPKIQVMCQTYKSFVKGFQRSQAMLGEMKKEKYFLEFMQKAENGQLTMNDFINRPIQHIQNVNKILTEILALTPEHSPDFESLQTILHQLSQCVKTVVELYPVNKNENTLTEICSVNKVNDDLVGMRAVTECHGPMFELSSVNESQNDGVLICSVNEVQDSTTSLNVKFARTDKPEMESPVKVRSIGSLKSINFIGRLVFASNLREYQAKIKNMRVMHHGNVYKCNKKGSWIEHELFLFSEILLMSREKSDGSLFISESPVHVQDLDGIETSRTNPSEFVLHVRTISTAKVSRKQPRAPHFNGNGSTMILRAVSEQDKFLWKSLLEREVSAVTGRSLQIVSPTRLV